MGRIVKSRLWATLLVLWLLLWVWWAIEFPLDDSLSVGIVLGSAVLVVVGLIPVAALALAKPVGPRWLWQGYFAVGCMFVAFGVVRLVGEALRGSLSLSEAFVSLAAFGIHVAYLVALDVYLNRRPTLWAPIDGARNEA